MLDFGLFRGKGYRMVRREF